MKKTRREGLLDLLKTKAHQAATRLDREGLFDAENRREMFAWLEFRYEATKGKWDHLQWWVGASA